MSTVIPNNAPQIEDSSSSKQPAPKNIIKNTYETVLAALQANKNLILITGEVEKGKTALLNTISKEIAAKNRIITLSGKDLPSLEKSKYGKSELNIMKDYILKSSDLDDKLVVTLDDANYLPISFLGELIEHAKLSSSNDYSLQLILSGPLNFKDQLLAIEQISQKDITHCPMDSMNEEEIHTYLKTKSYKISSNIKRLEIKSEALKALADFIRSDKQVLDVILEWCAAIVKKEQLTSMTSETVNRATSYAQQFTKDHNLRLPNSYPPSHEVYKYINDIQSTKKHAEKSTAIIAKKSVSEQNKNEATKQFIKTSNKVAAHESKIPTITSKVKDGKKDPYFRSLDQSASYRLQKLEDEIMPPQWTPSLKQKSANKLFSSSIAGLMTLLLLSFGAFIAYHIASDTEVWSNVEVWFKQQVALYKSEEAIIKNQAETEVIDSKTVVTKNTEIRKAEEAFLKPHTGIVASDINKPIDINKTPVKISDEKLAVSKQEKLLEPQEGHNTKDKSSSAVEINRLILLAEYQFENKKLSTPSGDNALETYQKILAKYPNNEQARNGIKKVHEKYLSWAGFYHQRNEFKRAKLFYNKALDIDPSNNLAKTNLQNIAQEEAASKAKRTTKPNALKLQETKSPESIQDLLDNADQKMQQIEIDIDTNNRSYKVYKETQEAYQNVLRSQPQNKQAMQGLFMIKNYYADWAELQTQSKNYNIALFLYGQALSIDPGDAQITQRIEQIRELKKTQ